MAQHDTGWGEEGAPNATSLCCPGDSQGDTFSGHTIGWAVFRAHGRYSDLKKGILQTLHPSLQSPKGGNQTPKSILEPPRPARPKGAPEGGGARCDSWQCRGRAPSATTAGPSTARPRHGHPGVPTPQHPRVPPAVPQQTGPAPVISSPTARPGRCWALPLKTPAEPGPGAHPAVKSLRPREAGGTARHSRDAPHLPCAFLRAAPSWSRAEPALRHPALPKNLGCRGREA